MIIWKCDCCEQEGKPFYKNEFLLGREDELCEFCFLAWYDYGLTKNEEIVSKSLELRKEKSNV